PQAWRYADGRQRRPGHPPHRLGAGSAQQGATIWPRPTTERRQPLYPRPGGHARVAFPGAGVNRRLDRSRLAPGPGPALVGTAPAAPRARPEGRSGAPQSPRSLEPGERRPMNPASLALPLILGGAGAAWHTAFTALRAR